MFASEDWNNQLSKALNLPKRSTWNLIHSQLDSRPYLQILEGLPGARLSGALYVMARSCPYSQTLDLGEKKLAGTKTGDQVSISPTFYEQLLRQNPFAKKLETQIVST